MRTGVDRTEARERETGFPMASGSHVLVEPGGHGSSGYHLVGYLVYQEESSI